jgi:hypothetical protein
LIYSSAAKNKREFRDFFQLFFKFPANFLIHLRNINYISITSLFCWLCRIWFGCGFYKQINKRPNKNNPTTSLLCSSK